MPTLCAVLPELDILLALIADLRVISNAQLALFQKLCQVISLPRQNVLERGLLVHEYAQMI